LSERINPYDGEMIVSDDDLAKEIEAEIKCLERKKQYLILMLGDVSLQHETFFD